VSYIRYKFGGGPPDPEDIVQEAFARLASQQDTAQLAEPQAFLKSTARNIAIDAYRSSVRGAAVMQSVAVLKESDREIDALDVLSSRDELERLAAIIDTLKPKQRVALLLHRLDGLSFAEIGRRMGISPSGARLLVKGALATCARRMKQQGGVS
jgi:RNA polymerase sigma-70 factor (ECF subfamily)